ncbi:sensor histidine kinase, partial [Acinetobacter baumannii]
MERVLVNLLENAAKYTPPGSRVLLSARRNGEAVEISVADDGPGLPAEHVERLFEKFTRWQVETTTPGVGLGLAICQSIVE